MPELVVFGGAAESAELCGRLCSGGAHVLLSTATGESLALPDHPALRRICGRLDREGMARLLTESACRAVVCAVHPYAAEARDNIRAAAAQCGLPCLIYLRPSSGLSPEERDGILHVACHAQAAELAVSFSRPVLVTTGSNDADVYLHAARRSGVRVLCRALDSEQARERMRGLGFSEAECLYARGPFSVEQNRAHLRMIDAGVLVTKDGGGIGGLPQKLQAARLEGCRVILVDRPQDAPDAGRVVFRNIGEVAQAALAVLMDSPIE